MIKKISTLLCVLACTSLHAQTILSQPSGYDSYWSILKADEIFRKQAAGHSINVRISVNYYLIPPNLLADPVTVNCNGNIYRVNPDKFVDCRLPPYGIFTIQDAAFKNGTAGIYNVSSI